MNFQMNEKVFTAVILIFIPLLACKGRAGGDASKKANSEEGATSISSGSPESPECATVMDELSRSEDKLADELGKGFTELSKACNHSSPILSYGDEGLPSLSELNAAVIAIAPESNRSSSSDALALTDTEISCSARTAEDPTGCSAIHNAYRRLEQQINSRLDAQPATAEINPRRVSMVGLIGGASRIIADITVPHCNQTMNVCRVRARARGVSPSGRWATGSCYETIAQKAADANWAVFTCADGLRCEGYVEPTGILSIFQRPTYGSCRVVNRQSYERYFTFRQE